MFTESFNESFNTPTNSKSGLYLAAVKKANDPLLCGSYRPISLLNVDFKLLSKLLARRLEVVLPSIVSSDQTGFIRNRHFFNLRRVFNVVYNPSPAALPEILIALEVEKAFDRVGWDYLFFILGKFGFGFVGEIILCIP